MSEKVSPCSRCGMMRTLELGLCQSCRGASFQASSQETVQVLLPVEMEPVEERCRRKRNPFLCLKITMLAVFVPLILGAIAYCFYDISQTHSPFVFGRQFADFAFAAQFSKVAVISQFSYFSLVSQISVCSVFSMFSVCSVASLFSVFSFYGIFNIIAVYWSVFTCWIINGR
ncbi:hypothetical protein EDD86DRAFT_96049 [Gorgonomyces haynaldii]|nr:hypothetical protein EDD86DRAFT_96049 [Gorgonomyces haynaldii]